MSENYFKRIKIEDETDEERRRKRNITVAESCISL